MTDLEKALYGMDLDDMRGNQLWDPWSDTRYDVRHLEDIANESAEASPAELRQAA